MAPDDYLEPDPHVVSTSVNPSDTGLETRLKTPIVSR